MKKWSIVLFVLLLIGCEPKPKSSDLLKNYVVMTNKYVSSFSQYSTYYLSIDTLVYVYNTAYSSDSVWQCTQCSGKNNQLGSGYVDITTNEVNANMNNGGFTKVEWSQNPDIEVFISVVEDYSESYYGGGYYYGSYYPTVSVSDQWTMHIYLVDVKKETLIWEGDISDISATIDNDGSLLVKAIDKAFQQSSVTKNP